MPSRSNANSSTSTSTSSNVSSTNITDSYNQTWNDVSNISGSYNHEMNGNGNVIIGEPSGGVPGLEMSATGSGGMNLPMVLGGLVLVGAFVVLRHKS